MFCTFSLENVLLATAACNFSKKTKLRQATKKNKLQTHFGQLLLLSCQTCLGIVCLHVSTLPVSDQISALHAVSVLSTVDFKPDSSNNNELTTTNMFETFCIQNQ